MKLIKDLYITFICTILVNRHTLSAYVLQAVFSPNHLMEYRVLVHFGRWVHHLFSTEETGVCVNTFLTTIVTLITPHQYCNTDSDVTGGEWRSWSNLTWQGMEYALDHCVTKASYVVQTDNKGSMTRYSQVLSARAATVPHERCH